MALTVKYALIDQQGNATVGFVDGHRLTFMEHREPGASRSMTIEAVWLDKRSHFKQMWRRITFYSPHIWPRTRETIGIAEIADGYTARHLAEYWQAAVEAVDRQKDEFIDVWLVLNLSRGELRELQQGVYPIPAATLSTKKPSRPEPQWRGATRRKP